MSIDYRGSVVDLLNEAKEVEAGQRLFVLEQVREILRAVVCLRGGWPRRP